MELKVIFEDKDYMVLEKPASIIVFSDNKANGKTLADVLLENFPFLKELDPPRYGIVHRLDKDTSGILLVAKNKEAFSFFQKQFKERKAKKKYLALINGKIKERQGTIQTLIGRSPKNRLKQKIYFPFEPKAKGKREAVTFYKVLSFFEKGKEQYSLLEVDIKTGRKHQIRVHLSHIGHAIAGDKLYGSRKQKNKGLDRIFLHSSFLEIETKDGKKQFESELPKGLKTFLESLEEIK